MPQPLRKIVPLNNYKYITKISPIAFHIGEIALLWTDADISFGMLLNAILGLTAAIPLELYSALINTGARSDVMRTVAKPRLSHTEYGELLSLIAEYRKRAAERNAIVHGVWKFSPTLPDAIILLDSNKCLQEMDRLWSVHLRRRKPSPTQWNDAMCEGALIYKEKDFLDIEHRIHVFSGKLELLAFNIRRRHYLARKVSLVPRS